MRLFHNLLPRICVAAFAMLVSDAATADPPLDSIEQRVLACAACHGEQGRATPDGYFPRIAGKPAGYLFQQLVNFREGRRSHATMSYLVDRQRDAYLREIAEHYAGLSLPYAAPAQVDLPPERRDRGRELACADDTALGVPACQSCHGERLTGVTNRWGLTPGRSR